MRKFRHRFAAVIPAALAVFGLAAIHSAPASAQLTFQQGTGLCGGPGCVDGNNPLLETLGGGAPTAGQGGFDVFGTPLFNPPMNTWRFLAWGCGAGFVNCANGGSIAGPPWTVLDPTLLPQSGQRSYLNVEGQSGTLPVDPAWTDITVVNHKNQDIDGNVLTFVEIDSNLQFGPNHFSPGLTFVNVDFTETPNHAACTQRPAPTAPINPLSDPANPTSSECDDFATISNLDFASLFVSAADSGASQDFTVNFRLHSTLGDPGALVCTGLPTDDPRCTQNGVAYNGCLVDLVGGACPAGEGGIVIYTKEHSTNTISVQANVSPPTTPAVPTFVIGDCEYQQAPPGQAADPIPPDNNLREVGDLVNFWGSQWWKNNCMSLFISNGYPAFKGFATNVSTTPIAGYPCGEWQARPGNSGHPPATLPNVINIIVTDNVVKDGPNISGHIKQIVTVDRSQASQDNYAGNPGHQGWGVITQIVCGTDPGNVP